MVTSEPSRDVEAVEAGVRSESVGGPATDAGHRTTSVVVGTASLVWDRLASSPQRFGLRDVAVGAVFGAEDAAAGLLARVRHAAALPRQRSVRQAAAVVEGVRRRLVELAERGAAEQTRGRRRAADAVNSAMEAVATAAVVDRVVDAQLNRVLRPLVVAVLDDVLALLEAEPERVQSLIREQREGMVDELVERIRAGATAGDTAVDRLAARVFRRTVEPAPTSAPTTGPA
jgi:hypothetical protein